MVEIEKGLPFTLPDGTIVYPGGDGPPRVATKKQQILEEELKEHAHDPFDTGTGYVRSLADLPSEKRNVNPTMIVLAYSIWGLPPQLISMFLEIPEDHVRAIQLSDMYARLRKELVESVRYAETSSIHGFLESKAKNAALKVAEHMNSEDDDLSMKAAQDILNRSGYSPSERHEHVHKFEDDLRIVHLHEAPTPTIDVDMNGDFDDRD